MRIEHAALWTADLEKMRKFYIDSFGATAGDLYENVARGFRSYFIRFGGGARLELMQQPDRASHPEAADHAALGWAHVAISVGDAVDVDRLTERLAERGVTVISGPRWTGDGYYESVILDPENNRVEIMAEPAGLGEMTPEEYAAFVERLRATDRDVLMRTFRHDLNAQISLINTAFHLLSTSPNLSEEDQAIVELVERINGRTRSVIDAYVEVLKPLSDGSK